MKGQLGELVTRYDPGGPVVRRRVGDEWTDDRGKDLYAYVRGLKPTIIVNNRVGKGRDGMRGLNRQDDGQPGPAISAPPSRRSRRPASPASTGRAA